MCALYHPKTRQDSSFRMPTQCAFLKLNGSWPLAERRGSDTESGFMDCQLFGYVYTGWAWYVILSVGITICFQTAFLVTNFTDIMMTTENCCSTLMGLLNLVRLLHLRLNQRQFRRLLEHFEHNIWIRAGTHPSIERECQQRMSTFRIMTALLACLILMYCMLPLVELCFVLGLDADEKPFPYKMVFPYDPQSTWLRYLLTYVFTSYAGICVVTTLFAEDSLLGFFITYTCGQFRILHESIDELVATVAPVALTGHTLRNHASTAEAEAVPMAQAAEEHQMEAFYYKEYVRRQKLIARQHNKLIRFAKHLEDFFNPILLMNLIISSVLICMVGFQLVTGKNMFIGDYFKFIVYISSCLSQLYILCGNGDTLIKHSTKTAQHLYECHWEGQSDLQKAYENLPPNKEFRTNLQFMILCAQRPVKITAFKFSTLSFQSFTAILSTSMSYFTLLRSLLDSQ